MYTLILRCATVSPRSYIWYYPMRSSVAPFDATPLELVLGGARCIDALLVTIHCLLHYLTLPYHLIKGTTLYTYQNHQQATLDRSTLPHILALALARQHATIAQQVQQAQH